MGKNRSKYRLIARRIVDSKWFTLFIMFLIILNGLLIGVQTYDNAPSSIRLIQLSILFIFFLEIFIRWTGRHTTEEYVGDWWNWFDIFILMLGVIPEVADILLDTTNKDQQNIMSTLRILRVVQLTRSIRAIGELQLLIGVLIKSIRSLSYIAVLFLLIMYIYAIIGVTLFRNPDYNNSEHIKLTISNPDPYGDLGEAFFTLFRILTGEDWTDLRYNLLSHKEVKSSVPTVSNTVITFYHVSWMIIAAYLLINLVIGAIVNNFQIVLEGQKEAEEKLAQRKKEKLRAATEGGDDEKSDNNKRPNV
ncbi:MAG: Putative cation transporter component [uncultured Aureispira sp.]|uniref:Cation transporter component n=1 Tax=uncultured Aureispira sp. TaxID=1331704 RepID=A0A6S6ULX8_9BACT|nr:MAG: Putative cation transporter component [uncultured Aureispira sp.]